MVTIRTNNLTKTFGEVIAVDQVDVEIKDGEFFTFLGPSGCGKTTFLRCVAGFELVDDGKIFFGDTEVTDQPPHKRKTGMVFQNYALWPHMTVHENVAYGLRIRKVPKDERKRRVREVLELVQLGGMEDRTPHQLSGGQQQRVALARALVINPRVLLFDEPLSNLDAKLRLEMRAEIKKIQESLGITTIYVTHDQEEAMSISERIGIMNRGRLEQVGDPFSIYYHPENSFIAEFIGQGTFLEGTVVSAEEYVRIALPDGKEIKGVPSEPSYHPKTGDKVLVAIRPESFSIDGSKTGNSFECSIFHVSFLGNTARILADHDGERFVIEADPHQTYSEGQQVTVTVEPERTLAIRKTTP